MTSKSETGGVGGRLRAKVVMQGVVRIVCNADYAGEGKAFGYHLTFPDGTKDMALTHKEAESKAKAFFARTIEASTAGIGTIEWERA